MSTRSLDEPATGRDLRFYRAQVRKLFALAVVAVLVAIASGVITERIGRERDEGRDEALKYQVCVQRAQTAVSSNAARRVTRELAERAARFTTALSALVDAVPTDAVPDPLLSELRGSSDALGRAGTEAASEADTAPVPDCAATYPRGFEVTRRIGIVAPTVASPTR